MNPLVNHNSLNNIRQVEHTKMPFAPEAAQLTFFKVVAVNEGSRTVDIEFIHSKVKERNVSYLSPFISAQSGTDFLPKKNDVGIVARTAANGRVIIGFLAGQDRNSGVPISPGDILTKTGVMSVVKQDDAGNIIMATEKGATVSISPTGRVCIIASDMTQASDAKEAFEGVLDGHIVSKEEFFEDTVESAGSIADNGGLDAFIDKLMTTGEIAVPSDRKPAMRITAVNKLDDSGTPQKVDVFFDGSDGDIIYEIEVLDKTSGLNLSSITFDRNGNILIKADKLIYDVNEIVMK